MLTVQKKTFSLAGMSPKSSNMTAKSGINTADTSKVYHLLVVGTDALIMPETSGDDVSVEKVSGCAREFLVVDDFLCSRSDSTKTFVHARDVAHGMMLAIERYPQPDPINLSSDELVSVKDLVLTVRRLSGRDVPVEFDTASRRARLSAGLT